MKENLPTYTLSFKNVPDERTEDDIRKVFAPFGTILSVQFPLNKLTGARLGTSLRPATSG